VTARVEKSWQQKKTTEGLSDSTNGDKCVCPGDVIKGFGANED
jgi:hypothetical protein